MYKSHKSLSYVVAWELSVVKIVKYECDSMIWLILLQKFKCYQQKNRAGPANMDVDGSGWLA